MSSRFVHLHNHSHYSIGDAISKIGDIFTLTDKYNMPAVALTDHGNMFGIAEFLLEAKKYPNINAIVGCEVYVSPENMKEKPSPGKKNYYHLLLLAQNENGYKNLSKLVSASSLDGFYYRPRVDYRALQEFSNGIIASSACLGGEVAQLILQRKIDEAEQKALFFKDIFGSDNFFLELMNHGLPEQKMVNKELLKIASKNNIPIIATNDVHYPYKGDDKAHDVFLCIQEGKKVQDPARKKYHSQEFFFKTEEEMREAMQEYPEEAITNTVFLANKCSYKPVLDELHIPSFDTGTNQKEDEYLKELCQTNMLLKYNPITAETQERLNYELSVIQRMGFASYFLIVQDFIQYAKQNNINVGPGRGSAAGSLVAYLLGITDLEPLRYNLLFERFLNPGRISMPDIDTDFEDTKRDEIINYVTRKYGQDKVAQIVAFGKMKAKSVIRDVGRVLDVPLSETDMIAKLIPNNTSLKDTYNTISEFKEKINSSPLLQNMYELCLRLENSIRQTSTHAAGIIIGKDTLTDFVPLHKDRKTGAIITQFEGKHLEEFGLLKMDFLGLRNLRIIYDALNRIKNIHNISIDINNIPLDDKKTFNTVFKEGKGTAIFQCESPGMRTLMKKMQPSSFEDIIALVALFRPGPLKSGMADDFIKNKKLPLNKIPFPHPDLTDILRDTYGVIIYQEQIMQISQHIAGFSLEEADNLRKAMGKKDIAKMDSMASIFKSGAEKKGYNAEFSKSLFDNMAKFAEYGFNKSHSAAYALIAYQTAYLKAYYPVEYMCAVLSAESSTLEGLTKYIQECKDLGITVLPPDINKSGINFSIENKNIRFGLSAIKNVGEKNIINIIEERLKNGPYLNIADLVSRVSLNKKIIEGLCFGGALTSLDMNRASIIENIETILSYGNSIKNNTTMGMDDLFGADENIQAINVKIVEEYSDKEILEMEKNNLGFYATAHPLDRYKESIIQLSSYSTLDLKTIKEAMLSESDDDGQDIDIPNTVYIAGRVIDYQVKMTKNNEPMAIFKIEDIESEIPAVIFPKAFKDHREKLESEEPLFFVMKVDFSKFELQGIVNHVKTISEALKQKDSQETVKFTKLSQLKKKQEQEKLGTSKEKIKPKEEVKSPVFSTYELDINLENCSEHSIQEIKNIIEKYPGNQMGFTLNILNQNKKTSIVLGNDMKTLFIPLIKEELSKLPFVKRIHIY